MYSSNHPVSVRGKLVPALGTLPYSCRNSLQLLGTALGALELLAPVTAFNLIQPPPCLQTIAWTETLDGFHLFLWHLTTHYRREDHEAHDSDYSQQDCVLL